ncbi:hypothetical protein ACEPAF_2207 [Sanghuangporus sanghuang]
MFLTSLPFISFVAVLVTLITENTFASPTVVHSTSANATSTSVEKRTPGGVFICTELNWGGTCGYAVQPLNECIPLGSDWDKQISSFGPDPCTICFAYRESNCDEAEWEFTNPGDATGGLGTSDPWNDQISAFLCEQTC